MSKSRYNVVNPDKVVDEQGADTLRLYEMFMGPLDRDKPWTEEGLHGINRFIRRVWALIVAEDGSIHSKIGKTTDAPAMKVLHQTIKTVSIDIDQLQFNTAISRMMEFLNAATKAESIARADIETFVRILSPFAPHLCEELWERLGHDTSIAYEPWPEHDESFLVEANIEIPVQVNGKLRGVVTVPAGTEKDAVIAAAKAEPRVAAQLDGKQIVKEIYVPGKLTGFVVK